MLLYVTLSISVVWMLVVFELSVGVCVCVLPIDILSQLSCGCKLVCGCVCYYRSVSKLCG